MAIRKPGEATQADVAECSQELQALTPEARTPNPAAPKKARIDELQFPLIEYLMVPSLENMRRAPCC